MKPIAGTGRIEICRGSPTLHLKFPDHSVIGDEALGVRGQGVDLFVADLDDLDGNPLRVDEQAPVLFAGLVFLTSDALKLEYWVTMSNNPCDQSCLLPLRRL